MQPQTEGRLLTSWQPTLGSERPQITLTGFVVRTMFLAAIAALVLLLVAYSVSSAQVESATAPDDRAVAVNPVAPVEIVATVACCPGYEIVHTDEGLRCVRSAPPIPGTLGLGAAPAAPRPTGSLCLIEARDS